MSRCEGVGWEGVVGLLGTLAYTEKWNVTGLFVLHVLQMGKGKIYSYIKSLIVFMHLP